MGKSRETGARLAWRKDSLFGVVAVSRDLAEFPFVDRSSLFGPWWILISTFWFKDFAVLFSKHYVLQTTTFLVDSADVAKKSTSSDW